MRMIRRTVMVAIVLVVGAARARADRAGDALGLLDKGIAQFNAGQLHEARESFARARDLVPEKANPYRWLGLVDARMGRCADAVKELDTFLAKVPPSDGRVAEAVTLRDRCKDELVPRLGTLVVESVPPDAEVRLDDANAPAAGKTPYRNEAVPAGNHALFVRKSGYEAVTRGVALAQKETVRVELTLKPEAVVAGTAPPVAPPLAKADRPKKRYWIAGVVVGVVAAAALGVGLGVGLTQSSSADNTLPAIDASKQR
jgi:hypothetical protein